MPITSLTLQQQEDVEQIAQDQLNAALLAQHMRDHPEDTPAAVAARIASHPDIVATAKAEWEATWDKEHPLKTSFDRPTVPDDYLDKAIRAAEAQRQPDLDSRIAALEDKIAQLQRQRSASGPQPTRALGSDQIVRKAPAPTSLPKPNPASILTRTLPDGRVMAIIGSETIYFKNAAEAKAAIDKVHQQPAGTAPQ